MKNLMIAALLIVCIFGMAYIDWQLIQKAPYPTLSQEQTK